MYNFFIKIFLKFLKKHFQGSSLVFAAVIPPIYPLEDYTFCGFLREALYDFFNLSPYNSIMIFRVERYDKEFINQVIKHPFIILNRGGVHNIYFHRYDHDFTTFPPRHVYFMPPKTENIYDITVLSPAKKPWHTLTTYQKVQSLLEFERTHRWRNDYILFVIAQVRRLRFNRLRTHKYVWHYYITMIYHSVYYLVQIHLKYCKYVQMQLDSFCPLHDFMAFYKHYQSLNLKQKLLYDSSELKKWEALVDNYCDGVAKRVPYLRIRLYSAEHFFFYYMRQYVPIYNMVNVYTTMPQKFLSFPLPRRGILFQGREHQILALYSWDVAERILEGWPTRKSRWKYRLGWNLISSRITGKVYEMPPYPPIRLYYWENEWMRPYWHPFNALPPWPLKPDFEPLSRIFMVKPLWIDNFNDLFLVRFFDYKRHWNEKITWDFNYEEVEMHVNNYDELDDFIYRYWENPQYSIDFKPFVPFFIMKKGEFFRIFSNKEAFNNICLFFSVVEEEWKEHFEENFEQRWNENLYKDFLEDPVGMQEIKIDAEYYNNYRAVDPRTGLTVDFMGAVEAYRSGIPQYEFVLWHKYLFLIRHFLLFSESIFPSLKEIEKNITFLKFESSFFYKYLCAIHDMSSFLEKFNSLKKNAEELRQLHLLLLDYVQGFFLKAKKRHEGFRGVLTPFQCLVIFCDHRVRLHDIYARAYLFDDIVKKNEIVLNNLYFANFLVLNSCHSFWLIWFKLLEFFNSFPFDDSSRENHQISQVLRLFLYKKEKVFELYKKRGYWPSISGNNSINGRSFTTNIYLEKWASKHWKDLYLSLDDNGDVAYRSAILFKKFLEFADSNNKNIMLDPQFIAILEEFLKLYQEDMDAGGFLNIFKSIALESFDFSSLDEEDSKAIDATLNLNKEL